MGLCNLYEYQTKKTVKLSDAYSIDLYLDKEDFATDSTPAKDKTKVLNLDAIPNNYKMELFNCTDVTLPAFKYKTEIYKYGNNEKTFLLPDYSSLDDLSIELMEYYDKNDNLVVQQLVNLFLNKLFDTDTFTYRMHKNAYIKQLDVNVYDNNFSMLMYTYTFKYLKLTNYTKYDLDYSSNSPAKWKLSFSYMEYEATPVGKRAFNVNGENDPNLSTTEPITETNVDFAEMYKAIMAGRAGRAPSDSTSMLTPNAYNNNSDDIAALKPQVKKLSQNIENQQAHVAASKAKVKELEDKIAAAEATLNDPMFKKQLESATADMLKSTSDLQKYTKEEQEHYDKAKSTANSGGLLSFTSRRQMQEVDEEYRQGYIAKQNKEAAASNLELYKQEAANLNAIYEQNTNNIAEWKAQLAQEKQNLDNLNRGFNNLKLDYNNKINELSEMESLKKDQIASLENRYGSMNSLSQQDFNASRSSYAASMSQAVENSTNLANYATSMKDNAKTGHISDPYTEKEEQLKAEADLLHSTASKKATDLWSPDQSELDNELSSINDVNKISLDMYKFDDPEAQEKQEQELKQKDDALHMGANNKAAALWSDEQSELHNINAENKKSLTNTGIELYDPELDEEAERSNLYGSSETSKKIMLMGKANAEADEAAQQKFAEKAGVKKTIVGDTEYTNIDHAEEIYKHKDFQARVLEIMQEKEKNKQPVNSEFIQQQVLNEYISGKLKLK